MDRVPYELAHTMGRKQEKIVLTFGKGLKRLREVAWLVERLSNVKPEFHPQWSINWLPM